MSERKRGSRLSNFMFAVFVVSVVGSYSYCATPTPVAAADAGLDREDAGVLVKTLDAALDEQELRAAMIESMRGSVVSALHRHCWHFASEQHAVTNHYDVICCRCGDKECRNESLPEDDGHGEFAPSRSR